MSDFDQRTQHVGTQVNIAHMDGGIGWIGDQYVIETATFRIEDAPKTWDGDNPFLGLRAFAIAQAKYFFGREAISKDLSGRLRAARFFILSGPSGSGKSSLVYAGILPRLHMRKPDSQYAWNSMILTPQNDPLARLGRALAQKTGIPDDAAHYVQEHADDAAALFKQADLLLGDNPYSRLLIFVDQFEELFSPHITEETRRQFVDQLLFAASEPGSRISILVALRSDFLGRFAALPALNEQLNKENQFYQLGDMTAVELAQAVRRPVQAVGATIEDDLVDQVVSDTDDQPGELPLLQFAMHKLFQNAATTKGAAVHLTLTAYNELGGLDKTLQAHADAVTAAFRENNPDLIQAIFRNLISVDEEDSVTRKIVPINELAASTTDPATVQEIIHELAGEEARLLITGQQSAPDDGASAADDDAWVTITHERLINAWSWLANVVEENRHALRLESQIGRDAETWKQRDKDSSFLYSGAKLIGAQELLTSNEIELTGTAAAFLEAGEAQRLALRRRNVWALSGLILLTLVAIYAAVTALQASNLATARRLASDAALAAEKGELRLATLLVIEAMNRDFDDKDRLWRDVLTPDTPFREVGILASQDGQVNGVSWSPDSRYLVSASDNGILHIWDFDRDLEKKSIPTNYSISDVAWDPSGQYIASAGEYAVDIWNTQQIWDTKNEDEEPKPAYSREAADGVNRVAWSPDGRLLACAANDGLVYIWDKDNDTIASNSPDHEGNVHNVSWSPDGRLLASVADDGNVRIWDAESGEEYPSGWYGDNDVAWHPDGKRLAYGSDNRNNMNIWDRTSSEPAKELSGHGRPINRLSWSPDGDVLASASADGTLRFWDADSANELAVLDHGFSVNDMAWSSDGKRLASASDDNAIRIWERAGTPEMAILTGHTDSVLDVIWLSDGEQLASAGRDLTFRLWDANSRTLLASAPGNILDGHFADRPDGQGYAAFDKNIVTYMPNPGDESARSNLEGHEDRVTVLAWQPDGKLLASAADDKTARIWNIDEPDRDPEVVQTTFPVNRIAWHPDGRLLALASEDKTVRIWHAGGYEKEDLSDLEHSVPGTTIEPYYEDVEDDLFSDSWLISVGIGDAATGILEVARRVRFDEVPGRGPHGDLAWSPNGDRLAFVPGDATVRIWDTGSGEEVASLFGYGGQVNSVAWSPDGDRIATATSNNIHIRNAQVGCDRILSNLTAEEWRQYVAAQAPYKATCPDLPVPTDLTADLSLTYAGWAKIFITWIIAFALIGVELWLLYQLVPRYIHTRKNNSTSS